MRERFTTKDTKRNIDNERHEEKHEQHKTHRETLTTKDRETLTTKDSRVWHTRHGCLAEIYGNIWKYIKIYGNISKYMEIYGNISKYIEIYRNVWKCFEIYRKLSSIGWHMYMTPPQISEECCADGEEGQRRWCVGKSCRTCEWVVSHVCMSRVTCAGLSCRILSLW